MEMLRKVLGLTTLALCAAACAQQSAADRLVSERAGVDSPYVTATTYPAPLNRIDWNNPTHGIPVSSPAGAEQAGELSFAPTVPAFGSAPTATFVSDPTVVATALRSVTFIFDLTGTADFPTDGRVDVTEQSANGLTAADLAQVAAENPPDEFQTVTIAGRPALLIQGQGIARIMMIVGNVRFSIMGPAASPAAVEHLAAVVGS